jgi:HK97 family phage portal protein
VAERSLLERAGATLRSWFSGPVGPINWTQNGGIPIGWSANFWQQNLNPYQGGESATVNACVNAYAQTIAQLPGGHFKRNPAGGQKQVTTSPLARILLAPNGYQSRSDFMLNMVCDLMFEGNAYAWCERDAAGRPLALHPIPARGTEVMLEEQSRAIFYGLSDAPLAGPATYAIPQRDVLHIRGRTMPSNPLKGISPLRWAAMSTAANVAITASQAAFFAQASQPSGFLSTAEKLNDNQMQQLREAWANRTQHAAAGQVPVLGAGMTFQQLTMTSHDAQMVDAFRMTVGDIARAFGVPLPIIGDLANATFNNVEQLVAFWLSTGLGFWVEHIEIAFDKFFELPVGEFTELETDTLLRTAFKDRIDGLTKAVSGGLYTPNEARRREGLPDAEGGDEPRLQAQVVPLTQVNATPAPPALPAPSAPVDEEPQPDETVKALEALEHSVSLQISVINDETRALREAIEAIPPAPEMPAFPEIPDVTPALEAALEMVLHSLNSSIETVRNETRELRTMLEAAEPVMDPGEALELAKVQIRKAKEAARHAT